MSDPNQSSQISATNPPTAVELTQVASRINEVLKSYSDKDWNYSRIALETKELATVDSPYALWIDFIDTRTKKGKTDFETYSHEVIWGSRHSSELGILELISLRINKALLEISNDETWSSQRPAVRLVKKEDLLKQNITTAFWYKVTEVTGEEFDNR